MKLFGQNDSADGVASAAKLKRLEQEVAQLKARLIQTIHEQVVIRHHLNELEERQMKLLQVEEGADSGQSTEDETDDEEDLSSEDDEMDVSRIQEEDSYVYEFSGSEGAEAGMRDDDEPFSPSSRRELNKKPIKARRTGKSEKEWIGEDEFNFNSQAQNSGSLKAKYDGIWEAKFEQVKKFKEQHGRFPLKREETSMYNWLTSQRTLNRESKLSHFRKSMLLSLGYDLTGTTTPQNAARHLKKEQEGKSDKKASRQSQKRSSSPNADRKSRPWYEVFQEVKGMLNENAELSEFHKTWIYTQRSQHHRGILPIDRKLMLDSVGFDFNPQRKK